MIFKTNLGQENWPFSTAKAGIEGIEQTHQRNQQKRTKTKVRTLPSSKQHFISSFN